MRTCDNITRDTITGAVPAAWIAQRDDRGRVTAATPCGRPQAEADCTDGAVAEGIVEVLSGEREVFTWEYSRPTPDGSRRYCLRAARLPGAVEPQALITHEDITERRNAEDLTRLRVEELAALVQQRTEERDQFAYLVSHDLKAPLRGITNLSLWIEEDLGGALTGDVAGHLTLLRGRVRRLEAMIEGILQFSRVGRVEVAPEPVDVGALLSAVVDALAPPDGFQVDVAPGLPTLVAPRARLEQVFHQLIGNAVQHHDRPNGHVQISAADAGDFVEFVVSDDGPGIAPAFQKKVFQIFQTLKPHDDTAHVGVGLALVKKIVETQGGRVSLESQAGAGATFRFTWPRSYRSEE